MHGKKTRENRAVNCPPKTTTPSQWFPASFSHIFVGYRRLSGTYFRLTACLGASAECVFQPSTVDNVKATVPWKSRDHGGRWCMDDYLFDCRHERNTFLSSVQRRLSGGSVRSSRLTRRPRDKGAELVPLGREIDDCQVEAGLRAANEIGIASATECRDCWGFQSGRQLFNPRCYVWATTFSKLAINKEEVYRSYDNALTFVNQYKGNS